jgi:hypothetical protein
MSSHRIILSTCGAMLRVAALSIPIVAAAAGPGLLSYPDPLHGPNHCNAGYIPGPFGGVLPIVTWHDHSTNEDGFTVEWWREDPQTGWHLLDTFTTAANSTSEVIISYTGYHVWTGDHVRVRAFNSTNVSDWSNWDTFK